MEGNEKYINGLIDLEAAADHMIRMAEKVKKNAREERLKLEGVSTPSVRKGPNDQQIAFVLSNRIKTINKKAGSAAN
jgi:hypothetical protein